MPMRFPPALPRRKRGRVSGFTWRRRLPSFSLHAVTAYRKTMTIEKFAFPSASDVQCRDRRRLDPSMRIVPGSDCAALRHTLNIGRRSPAFPVTPRVRIRRFGRVQLSAASQSRNPERVEVSIRQREAECRTVRQPPRAMSAARRFRGEHLVHAPFPQFSKSYRAPLPLLPDHRP